ncbi:hypothetical protein NIES4071_00570 [Calothrix sp. NIES-4071]|nr:hypothetical protein NIES4071_00570 [Calothrix sp. NIES-4071]BAZ54403.1 hypothetical protein NIES4105_00560 [Calothrix sp. NIES-4105]
MMERRHVNAPITAKFFIMNASEVWSIKSNKTFMWGTRWGTRWGTSKTLRAQDLQEMSPTFSQKNDSTPENNNHMQNQTIFKK